MAPRKRCPVCRSKQWHKEPSSGLIACSEGHILQNYRKEVSDVDMVGPHAVRKRTIKVNKKKDGQQAGTTDPKLYHGNRGRYFYFQCLQLILRHQIAILIERWALPSEFEIVCRDLWALHLSLLKDPPPSESYLAAQDSDREEEKIPSTAEIEKQSPDPESHPPDPGPAPSDDDVSDNDAKDDGDDPELDDLLAENSASESTSDEDDGNKPNLMPSEQHRPKVGLASFEKPANTLAVIVLACWTLRIPILYRDMTQLIESYELPYLEAVRLIPESMKIHLTKQNVQALSPLKTPDTQTLHTLASSLARRVHLSYGIKTPEANAAPILWRVLTQCLGGGPPLYTLTKRLSTVLSLPLTLHHSLAPRLKQIKQYDVESHQLDNIAPELAFAATGIIVLKIIYGLDGRERLPLDSEDPAGDLPRLDGYLEQVERMNEGDSRRMETVFDSRTPMLLEGLDDDTVDQYLAFCERALIGPANDVLARFFPAPIASQTSLSQVASEEGGQIGLHAMRPRDREEEMLRPGEGYALGDGGEMSEEYSPSPPLSPPSSAMRRIASVFGRKDKDAAKSDVKRTSAPTPSPSPVPPPPTPSLASEHASSASSNGSASYSLQTPDDNEPVLTRTLTAKSKSSPWTAWLGKRSGTIKRGRPADPHSPLDQVWDEPHPDWRPKQPPPILHPPPTPKAFPQPPVLTVDIDSDEDASSEDSEDDEPVSLVSRVPSLHPPISPTQSRKNLQVLTQNSLVDNPPLVSPFSHLTGFPMYPRSSNLPHSLSVRPTLSTTMHRSALLRRLQSDTSNQLARSILPFASRPPPTPVDPPSSPPWFNARALPVAMTLSPSSPGLRRWMARPCFEERIAVWVPQDEAVICQPVMASRAVAELEFSAALDAMIGFGLPVSEAEEPLSVAELLAVPSPLRTSTLKSSPSKSPITETPPTAAIPDSAPAPAPLLAPPPAASRVRFAEDDKEDVIPLGYALRQKKRREDKAKFLREEQERRTHELERAKQEEERIRREQERRQWEEEKRAWEKEKKAMEEERLRRIYAEEVAATRARREHQRAGGGYGTSDGHLPASSSTTSLREERNRETYSRPLHDHAPRRQASEPAVPQLTSSPSSSPHTSSPGSSRPPSIAGHQAGSLRGSSRPASVHTNSSEDARHSSVNAGKRSSMASLPAKMPNNQFDWATYSAWSASNPTLMVPPVPPMPMYAMDMPLLPPTPPFMLQQYPRPRSQNHSPSPSPSSPSASPSRHRLPSNGSSERVNVVPQQPRTPSSRRGSNSSSSTPHRPVASHQRRSSDDARRASLPPPKDSHHGVRSQPSSLRSPSSSSLSRGRPPIPSSVYQPPLPSPWSAPPLATSYSQQQLSSAALINGYGQHVPPKANRRQTTIS
ncbi:hypothetical protein R3P38DRAFT_2596549 [Favolaschia claudopus]|uniref:Uncharacterized protein n=1 Tax=Favolaschia claudopus TaxID=2862362 RepID=A0AAW0E9Z3_9AGAR